MTTIFALATGASHAAIAVLRLSGPEVRAVLARIAGSVPDVRRATLRLLRSAGGEVLDRSVVLFWQGPESNTGEDYAELHVHGGRAVLEAVSGALIEAGVRPAEAGEFTRRAFLNGKLDLLQAEGMADLVAAETESQRRLALGQLGGAQSTIVAAWAERLRRVLAWQEALIDFPDEDLPPSVQAELVEEVGALGREMTAASCDVETGARVRDGLVVAISGAPNVGKSSLMNALAERDVAITSPVPGTTRDALECWIQIAGVGVTLIDTAGLRDTADSIEAEGVRRARARAAAADIVLHVADAGDAVAPAPDARMLRIANKIDLAQAPPGWIGVSALSREGLDGLHAALREAVLRLTQTSGSAPMSRARHRAALLDASCCLIRALSYELPELRGEEFRLAMRALGRITGSVGVEDVLETIFGAFCIGK